MEKEIGIRIFNRTNKGVSISKEGEDYWGYARQVLEQAAILEDRYKGNDGGKKQFCTKASLKNLVEAARLVRISQTD